jgi:hypothetical protein
VLAKHHRKCKLIGPVRVILHSAHMPVIVLQKSKPNNLTYTCGVSQAPDHSKVPREEDA